MARCSTDRGHRQHVFSIHAVGEGFRHGQIEGELDKSEVMGIARDFPRDASQAF